MNNIFNQNIKVEDLLKLLVSQTKEIKSISLDVFLNQYLELRKLNARKDTLIYFEENLKLVFNFFKSINILETKDINQSAIDMFVTFSINKKNKPITINKRIGILKTAIKYFVNLNIISNVEFSYKKIKETKTKIEIVKNDDMKKIINYLPNMTLSHQVIILLIISTGLRRNEVVNIKVSNINFKENSIFLDFTKNGKSRYCYFNNRTAELMKQLIERNNCKNNPYLFAKGNSHIDKQTISSLFYKLKRDLNIDVLSSHKLRHLYATTLLKNGADIYTVKELLGHSDIEMTQRYLDFTNEEIKENNFKFNPLNNF